MGVPAVGGYGGVMGPDWDSSGFNSDSGSSSIEDLGMGFARYGYGMMPPGMSSGFGMPPGGVGSVPNMSPGTSPLAAGAMSSPGGAAPGLPNTAASLGGASHITGPGSGPFGQPAGMMPFPPRPPGNAGTILTGSLSCADRPGSTILITKLVYGNGGMYTCSAPDQDCDVVDYRDQEITPFCDGRVRCLIRTTGKMLPACKATSNFVHVEYECIFRKCCSAGLILNQLSIILHSIYSSVVTSIIHLTIHKTWLILFVKIETVSSVLVNCISNNHNLFIAFCLFQPGPLSTYARTLRQ